MKRRVQGLGVPPSTYVIYQLTEPGPITHLENEARELDNIQPSTACGGAKRAPLITLLLLTSNDDA